MHRCLKIPEILYLICNSFQLSERYWYYEPSLTVHSLALVCRSFSEVALVVLWHTQNNLYNLVKCLPPDLWLEEYDDSDNCNIWKNIVRLFWLLWTIRES